MGRRLIDCQYFEAQDIAVIHEIVDGKRNYQIFKNPDFHFYVEPNLKQHKKETKYYKDVKELKRVDCKFNDRHLVAALETNYKIPEDGLKYYNDKKLVLANHNLYAADDQIEFRLIVDYYKRYKDEIDETLPLNYMFFDIEVHSDYDKKTYVELEKILHCIETNTQYELENDEIYLDHFNDLMNETNMDEVKEYIKNFLNKSITINYIDWRLYIALMKSKAFQIDPERIKNFIKNQLTEEKMNFIYDNIGFPDEEKANHRVDAISFVDVTKRKLYMYLLNVPNDLPNIEDKNYIKDKSLVENDLYKFIELFSIVSYLKNIDKSNVEACKVLLDNLDYLNEMYHNIDIRNEEDKQKVNEFVQLARTTIPNYENEVKVDIEYTLFDNELEMIKSFFDKIKNEIKPSILAAHNIRFDINTLKNRLAKYKVDFNKMINQFTVCEDKDLHFLQSEIKIDMLTSERKKEKTKYFCPGLVVLDTLLMYAKTTSGEKNWALDSIAKEELKDSKIGYDFEIYEFYFRDIKRFIKYSAVDTLLLMRLEEKLKFFVLIQLILSNSKTAWAYYMYRTTYLTNMIKYELAEREDGCFILRDNLTPLNPKKEESKNNREVGYRGAYNTDLSGPCDSFGHYENLFDLDFSAFYPNCAITTNLCVDQLICTTEEEEKHNDYMFMSKIGFGKKYLNLPDSEEIFNEI